MAPKKISLVPVEVPENNSGVETDQPIDGNNNNNNNNNDEDETTNNNNNDESNNNEKPTTVIVKHQLVLNDATTKPPLVSSREKRILAFKVSEISHGVKFLLMKLYTHDNTLPPIIFNISNEERVNVFKEFFGDNIPWEYSEGDESVMLFDFTNALSHKAYFEFLEIDKLPGSSAAKTIEYLKGFCSSATHVIKPKWSQDNTKPISQPYPDLMDVTQDEVEFCIRGTDGNLNVRPWYTEWIKTDKPHVPNSYISPTKAAEIASASSEFISPTAGGGVKRKFDFKL